MSTTFCRICEAACGLTVDGDPAAPRLRPDRDHPISRGFVCAKGTRFTEVALHPSRITHPVIRRGGALERTSWDDALGEAGARIRAVIDRHGPHAVGLYVGNPLAFHALGQIAAAGFSRGLGTRNAFSAGSQDCNNKFAAATLMHGSPVLHPIPDFERAELAVIFGMNPAVSQGSFVHLEGGATTFDRMIARGAEVVWVDVRETESAKRWGELLTIRPGQDVWLILALLGLMEAPPADPRVEGFATLHALAREVTPERAAARTGIGAARIRTLAEAIRTKRTALHGSVGLNQGPFGTLAYAALQGLAFASGNYDREGGSIFAPVAMAGARLARAVGLFRGGPRSRIGGFPTIFESLPGGILADEILTDGPERIRAMVVVAGDPLRSIPGARRLAEAFDRLETLVCVDLFESLAGQRADVILPATSWLERADVALPGLPFLRDDLIQTTGAVMPRVGEARTENEILGALSLEIGRPLFGSRLVTRLLSQPGLHDRAIPAVTALAHRLLDGDPARRGHGVPAPPARPGVYLGRGPLTPGNRVRFWHPELDAERARLLASPAPRDEGFVLLGRRRRIGHNSWLHGGTRAGKPEPEAWMARADLDRLGVDDGAEVELETETGRLRLRAVAREGIAPGTVVVPHGELDVNVNEILPAGPRHIEPVSGQLCMTGIPVEVREAVASVEERAPLA